MIETFPYTDYNQMPIKLRRYAKKKAPMTKRKYGGTRRYARKSVAGRVHVVKRIAQPLYVQNDPTTGEPVLTASGAASGFQAGTTAGLLPNTWETGLALQFKLSSVIDPTDLTQLFDRYKIVGVKLKIHYLQNASFIPGYSNLPTLYSAFDGDDATPPPTSLGVVSKGYCKSRVLNANRPMSVYIKPRVTKEIYNSALTTGYSSEKACWLDCNSADVPHYGLKMWLSDWVGGHDNNNAIRIQPTYYLAMRDTQ